MEEEKLWNNQNNLAEENDGIQTLSHFKTFYKPQESRQYGLVQGDN